MPRSTDRRELPDEVQIVIPESLLEALRAGVIPPNVLPTLLEILGVVSSASEAHRLIRDGAVEIDGQTVTVDSVVALQKGGIIVRVRKDGPRRIVDADKQS